MFGFKKKVQISVSTVKTIFQGQRGSSVFYDARLPEVEDEEVNSSDSSNPSESNQVGQSVFYDNQERIDATDEAERREKPLRPFLDQSILWSHSEAVRRSGVLKDMTSREITLQETKFEIITSELRYLNSLSVLIAVFYESDSLSAFCAHDEWRSIFGNILTIKAISEMLVSDLLAMWQEDLLLSGIYPLLRKHASSLLRVYVDYCANQPHALTTLRSLMSQGNGFADAVEGLESSEGKSLQSFLSLPVQRVTRYSLLLKAVLFRLHRLYPDSPEVEQCILALGAMYQLAGECNKAVARVSMSDTVSENSVRSESPESLIAWDT